MPSQAGGMQYSLDTSALLNPWRKFYPRDLFPTLWERYEQALEDGTAVATELVLIELEKQDDEVLAWAKERPVMFRPLDEKIQEVVTGILRDYPRLVDTRKSRSGADPFVIALGQIEGRAVVTYEGATNKIDRPNIPDVCEALSIPCVTFIEMARQQGWRI